jgi:tetratricopeptide (TPR) repeat protein
VPIPPRAPAVPAAESNYLEGLAMMQQGKFDRALELFTVAWKEKPGHPGIEENFPAAIEGLKKSGDEAQRLGRPEEAGKRWMAALAFLSHPALKGRSLSFAKGDLKASIDKLSSNLMEKGLADYRQGRLESAIATWRQILAYDPSHEEASKSVRTTTTQLENLKKIPPATGK